MVRTSSWDEYNSFGCAASPSKLSDHHDMRFSHSVRLTALCEDPAAQQSVLDAMRATWYEMEREGILFETDAWSKYERLGSLGSGAFGEVVLAKPKNGGGTKVAVKNMRTGNINLEDPRFLQADMEPHLLKQQMKLLREVEAHLRCEKHRNLVQLHAVHCNDGTSPEFVVEWVDGSKWNPAPSGSLTPARGHNLNTYITTVGQAESSGVFLGLEYSDVATVLAQVGLALQHLHTMGIIHRDVKPENVLVGESLEEIKLADYGGSSMLDDDEDEEEYQEEPARRRSSMKRTMSLSSGTRGYRAPEILFAVEEFESASVYDETCDLFSLGCLVYKVVTGRLPQADDTMYCTQGVPFPGDADMPRDLPVELFQEPERWRSGWKKRLSGNRLGQWTRSAEMKNLAKLTASLLRVESGGRIDLHEVLQGIAPYGERYANLNQMDANLTFDLERVASTMSSKCTRMIGEDGEDDFEAWCAAERRRVTG